MAETNGHEGISHPFGEKHGTATKDKRDLADRMYPHFHDQLARGSAAYATQLWTARHKEAVEAVKADLRELTLSHDEKHHAGWKPYMAEPNAPIPYYSVGTRPLETPDYIPLNIPKWSWGENKHTEHQQLISSDGDNFGLTNDTEKKDVLIEDVKKLNAYLMSPVKYDKNIINQAREALDEEWLKSGGKRYDITNNNCQHNVNAVLKKAAEIARASQKKLILD